MERENLSENEYYEISDKEKLPKRCPILDKCERRAWTLAFTMNSCKDLIDLRSESREIKIITQLINEGKISEDYEQEKVTVKGEQPETIEGKSSFGFANLCPEVILFENHRFRYEIPRISAISGRYTTEKYDKSGYYCSHFCECPEFSNYNYEKGVIGKLSKKTKRKKRPTISKVLRFEILQRDKFTCQYCGRSKDDGVKLEIDHRIPVSEGGKTTLKNLITSCYDCNRGKSDKIIE
jgi:5-methylcytosine-specific restriction endonuclease McrA